MCGNWIIDMFLTRLDPKDGYQNKNNFDYFIGGRNLEEKRIIGTWTASVQGI